MDGTFLPLPGTAEFVHMPGGKNGSRIVITIGDCAPVRPHTKKSPEQLARDVQFYEQFVEDDLDVAATLGLDPSWKLPPMGSPGVDMALQTNRNKAYRHHAKRQQCVYPENNCQWFPGGKDLQGYSDCERHHEGICVNEGNGPNMKDCSHIFTQFRDDVHRLVRAAFSIPQDKFVMYSYGTCATAIHNHIPNSQLNNPGCPNAPLIFTYSNWASDGESAVVKCDNNRANALVRDVTNVPGGVDFYMTMMRFEQL